MRLARLLRRPPIRALAASIALMGVSADAHAVGLELPFHERTLSQSESFDADGETLEFAQGGCSAAAAQAAAETGGQVLSVQVVDRGGQTMCVVTVLVPGRDGSRPRRQTITVPQ